MFAELFVWWLLAMALQEQATRPLQTLANVIAALREEDYSFRARGAATDDALGELSIEVNALADLLADQRIRAIEAAALLRRVVEEIEVPLFTFDPDQILRLVNSAGERLLQQSCSAATGAHRKRDRIGRLHGARKARPWSRCHSRVRTRAGWCGAVRFARRACRTL